MPIMQAIGQTPAGTSVTVGLPSPPQATNTCIRVYKVILSCATGAGVTHGSIQFNSIDPGGSGTRTYLIPLAASSNAIYQELDLLPGLTLWRGAGTGYSVIANSVGGNFVIGGILTVIYEPIYGQSLSTETGF